MGMPIFSSATISRSWNVSVTFGNLDTTIATLGGRRASAIERLDLLGEPCVDTAPLELGGGGHEIGVGQPFLAQDLHPLDPLSVVEPAHRLGEALVDLVDDRRLVRQLLERLALESVLGCP